MIITLRIKKIYFDEIKNKVKKIEYRNTSDYYNNIFNKKINYIILHYQGPSKILIKIKKISKIKRPKSLEDISIPFNPKVYKIDFEFIEEAKTIQELKNLI